MAARAGGTQDVHGLIQLVRTDIVLVVDGEIVDLNRIQLPKDDTDRRPDSNLEAEIHMYDKPT